MSPQISNRVSKSLWRGFMASVCVLMLFNGDASAFTAYVSNERSNTVSVVDTSKWEVIKTIKVGQRPRGIPRAGRTGTAGRLPCRGERTEAKGQVTRA